MATRHRMTVTAAQVKASAVKLAEFGGTDESSFEQSFSSIAHAYLRNRAPTLLDHELGFQLLDSSEDKKKAIGIMAFKVGAQTLYAPVFFLNGELKGHELLYIVEQDMFIPLQENWLNFLIQRKPHMLGTGVTRQLHSKGVRQPELNRLVMSPTKYASCIQPFLPVFGHLATTSIKTAVAEFSQHCTDRLSLDHFLSQAPLTMLKVAVAAISDNIDVAEAFEQFHGLNLLRNAIKTATARMETTSILDVDSLVAADNAATDACIRNLLLTKASAKNDDGPELQNDLKIITREHAQPDAVAELTEEDQQKLLEDGLLIQDHRSGEEVSVVVNVTSKQTLTNPSETGIYQVLTKPDGFKKCLVITSPCGVAGRANFCTVVSIDEGKSWANLPRKSIWVAGLEEGGPGGKPMEGGETAWAEWVDSLPEATTLSTGKSRYVLVGPRRNGTLPFRVLREISTSGDMPRYEIDVSDYCPSYSLLPATMSPPSMDDYDKYRDGARITLKAKGGTDFRSNRGELYIPVGAKVIKLEPAQGDTDTDEPGPPCCTHIHSHSDPEVLVPGNQADVEMLLMGKTAGLELRCRPQGYAVNGREELLSRNNTLLHLVVDWKIPVKQAEYIIKQADDRRRAGARPYTCRVKFALSSLLENAPTAPSMDMDNYPGDNMMGFGGPVQQSRLQAAPVPGMQANNYDRSGYNVRPDATPSPMDLQAVQDAAAIGQKEVFDVSMIGAMLKSVRDDTMIDRYIGDLMKALDRLGRIIFMFYWHQQKFAARYGKQDMPELEDGLRSTFESLGEIVLLLRQKSVDTFPEEGGQIFNPNPEGSSF